VWAQESSELFRKKKSLAAVAIGTLRRPAWSLAIVPPALSQLCSVTPYA
jgi:hypothetical protein